MPLLDLALRHRMIGGAADVLHLPVVGGLDFRGVTRATFDSLGGSAAGRLPAFTRIGIIGGEQSHQITEAEMAYHTHSVYDPTHSHQLPLADPWPRWHGTRRRASAPRQYRVFRDSSGRSGPIIAREACKRGP